MAASICVVPGILIIIVFVFIQKFGTDNLEPALAYPSTIFNTIIVSPCLAVLSLLLSSRCACCRRCRWLLISIYRPLSYHCAVLVKCVLLTIDGLILGLISILRVNLLTIGLKVEPTALILIISKYWCNLFISIIGCFIICDIHLQPANSHCAIVFTAKVVDTFLEAITVCVVNALCIVFSYPAIQHTAFIVKCIFLAVYSLQGNLVIGSIG